MHAFQINVIHKLHSVESNNGSIHEHSRLTW